MRLAALLQKWRHGPEAFSARDALHLATRGGARALGAEDEIGSLERGKRADFVVLDLNDVHSIMADDVDPCTRIVFGADRSNVSSVVIDGTAVYHEGRFPHLDASRIMRRSAEEIRSLLKRAEAG
jgi:cytosine/adenosine deaminase-related metal-dependent hydrolase